MSLIITFIGWHNCGKTTLASQVVSHLKARGYSVAVIKSTKETGLLSDQEGTDTNRYKQAGADAVALADPDQIMVTVKNFGEELANLASRFFSDIDIVIGEGFKEARNVAKIEVSRGTSKLLREQVSGVIALATDRDISDGIIFRLNESSRIADFIEQRFLNSSKQKTATGIPVG